MNKDIVKKIFPVAVKNFEEKKCTSCAMPIDTEDFRDDLSRREYKISGLCQSCQDDIFG